MDLQNLTKRDAYFVGYANAYQNRIEQMKAENVSWQKLVDKWPGSEAERELTPRIAANNREIATLSNRVLSILANVRRAA